MVFKAKIVATNLNRGYRMRRKMVLYGIPGIENLAIFKTAKIRKVGNKDFKRQSR